MTQTPSEENLFKLAEETSLKASFDEVQGGKINVKNSTPLLLGGPDGNTVYRQRWWAENKAILAKAIRGVWRWWTRTLIAGILWEDYALDYWEMGRIEDLLGLGSTNKASIYMIRIENLEIHARPRVENYFIYYTKKNVRFLHIPPYKLKQLTPIPRGAIQFSATLLRRHSPMFKEEGDIGDLVEQLDKLLITALKLSLTLGGIGKITSRGFGKFEITNKRGDILNEALNEISKGAYEHLKAYILSKISLPPREQPYLPYIPTFSPSTIMAERVHTNKRYPNAIWSILTAISQSTTKYYWKLLARKKGYTTYSPEREHGDKYHTWPLGLPRQALGRGYYTLGGSVRLKSPVIFTPIYSREKWDVQVTYMPTLDIERLLVPEGVEARGPHWFRELHWRDHREAPVRRLEVIDLRNGKTRNAEPLVIAETTFYNTVEVLRERVGGK